MTFGGGFQRANVYSEATDSEKSELKTALRDFVECNLFPKYSQEVSDDAHVKNIYDLSNHSKQFGNILRHNKINFGVSQKLLNLYLKYRWCMGDMEIAPPHFPVDRRIQEIIKFPKIVSWTIFTDHNDYMRIIDHVRSISGEYETIAEFELDHFERRFKTEK